MKKGINRLSVKVLAGTVLFGSIFFINTPSSAQAPAWTVSKGVQKVANKKQFDDQDLMRSHIQAAVVDQTWVSSKGVSNVGKESVVAQGNIPSTGTPGWANSKGVHQMKESKRVKENNSLLRTGDEITRQGK